MRPIILIAAMMAASSAAAETEYRSEMKRAGTYFCTSKQGGGVAYNESTDRWLGQGFVLEEGFVFKLALVGEKRLGDDLMPMWQDKYGEYNAELTYAGTDLKDACWARKGEHVLIGDDGGFTCTTSTSEFRLNLSNLRFVSISAGDYLLKSDPDDLPATAQIMVGTCTKID